MAKCKWCGKSVLFLPISKNGLCNACETIVVSEIIQAQKHINESTEIIKQSSNTDTIVSRFDFIVEKLKALKRFEDKGIPTIIPPPSKSMEVMNPSERDNHIVYGLEKELEKIKLSLATMKTTTGKMNRGIKFQTKCEDYEDQMENPSLLSEILESTQDFLDTLEKQTK